jgi:acetylglutamate kinase
MAQVEFTESHTHSVATEAAIDKARTLVEAMGWIRQFRDRHVVIKLGGSALEETMIVRSFLKDVIFLETVGMCPLLVHGGGKDITKAMKTAGIIPRFVQGRRYTDDETLEIVAKTLAEDLCESLVGEIRSQGGWAVGLNYSSQNVLIAQQMTLPGPDGEPIDLGRVGEVVDIQRDLLLATCRSHTIPVIPSIALDRLGGKLNVNADTAAAALASKLPAEKLIFVSDVPGVMLDKNDPSTLQSRLTSQQCNELIASGAIDAGMIPKIESALDALRHGVKKVHMIDARIPHALLLEIYSNAGIGTEIVLS